MVYEISELIFSMQGNSSKRRENIAESFADSFAKLNVVSNFVSSKFHQTCNVTNWGPILLLYLGIKFELLHGRRQGMSS